MYILDTDHLSLIQREGEAGRLVLSKLKAAEESDFSVTVITYEEQVRGRLSVVSRSRSIDEQTVAYRWLVQLVNDYRSIQVIAFDRAAVVEHQRLRKVYPRIGSMDLRIAAIALVKNATLLTRNKSDFGQIKELSIDDWSRV